jgi:hypothetical protein
MLSELTPLDVDLSFTGDDLVTLVAVVIIGAIILAVVKWCLSKF